MDDLTEPTNEPKQSVWHHIRNTKETRQRVLVTILFVVLYRFLLNIPLPGINPDIIRTTITPGTGLYTIVGFVSMFSGGSLLNFSVLALGLFPYNSASNILPLLIPVIPSLQKRMQDDFRSGRRWIEKWSYYLSFPIAVLTSYNLVKFLNNDGDLFVDEASTAFSNFLIYITAISVLTAGSFFAIWIAELISEYGIRGRGNSILIFTGIVGSLPQEIVKLMNFPNAGGRVALYVIIFIVCIVGVIYLLTGSRHIPIIYPQKSAVFYAMKRQGKKTPQPHLPLDLENGFEGLMGSQVLVSLIAFFMFLISRFNISWLSSIGIWVVNVFNEDSLLFGPIIFISVFVFTYFASDVLISQQGFGDLLKRSGAQIPGVHTGKATDLYIRKINSRIMFPTAFILGVLAIIPWIFNIVFDAKISLLEGEKIIFVVSFLISILKKYETDIKLIAQKRAEEKKATEQ